MTAENSAIHFNESSYVYEGNNTMFGSYGLKYEVISIDEQSGTAQVRCFVSNSSTIESGARPPVIGYTSVWKNTIGKAMNNAFSSGPLSKTTQTVEWTETVKWK